MTINWVPEQGRAGLKAREMRGPALGSGLVGDASMGAGGGQNCHSASIGVPFIRQHGLAALARTGARSTGLAARSWGLARGRMVRLLPMLLLVHCQHAGGS